MPLNVLPRHLPCTHPLGIWAPSAPCLPLPGTSSTSVCCLLPTDIPLSVGMLEPHIHPTLLNTVEFLWDPTKRTSVFVQVRAGGPGWRRMAGGWSGSSSDYPSPPCSPSGQVHCISTEFTLRKNGGEKGVPFRIQVDTFKANDKGEHMEHLHSASCLVKVFKVIPAPACFLCPGGRTEAASTKETTPRAGFPPWILKLSQAGGTQPSDSLSLDISRGYTSPLLLESGREPRSPASLPHPPPCILATRLEDAPSCLSMAL